MSNKSYFSLCYDQDDERKNRHSGYDQGADDGDHTVFCHLTDCETDQVCDGENGCCPINFDKIERKLMVQKQNAEELTPDD